MSDLQTVQDELTTAASTLDDLRLALRDGADVDLDSFNRMVAETCTAALSLPRADAPKVRRQLERLLGELTAAREEIASEQARLAEAIAEDPAAAAMLDADD
jgi:hypothetical protein